MKKSLKIIGFIILFIFVLLLVSPFILKKPIMKIANKEINKKINGRFTYNDFSISFISNFPYANISIDDVLLTTSQNLSPDTLLQTKKLSLSANIWKAWRENIFEVKSIEITDGQFNAIIDKNGKENWDIIKEDSETSVSDDNSDAEKMPSSTANFSFEKIKIKNLALSYTNLIEKQNIKTHITNADIKGNIETNNNITLDFDGKLEDVFFKQGDKVWVNNIPLECKTNIFGNLGTRSFQIKEGNLNVQRLPLGMSGDFKILKEGYFCNLKLETKKSDIATLLALIPEEYQKSIKGFNSKGEFLFSALLKGEYTDSQYPTVDIKTNITNGFLQLPEQQEALKSIQLSAHLTNYGKGLKNFKLNIPTASLQIANTPVYAQLSADELLTSPNVKGAIKTDINLEELQKVFPIKEMKLKGNLDMDVSFNGNLTDIENKQYDKFNTNGFVNFDKIKISSSNLHKDITIPNANLVFKTAYIELTKTQINIGKTNIALQGKLYNYIQYLTGKKALTGNFIFHSPFLDLTDLTSSSKSSTQEKESQTSTTTKSEILKIPENLELSLNSKIKKFRYATASLDNVVGNIKLTNGKIVLDNLNLQMKDGNIDISGSYNPVKTNNPKVQLQANIKNISVPELLTQIPSIKNALPIDTKTEGHISTSLNFSTHLDGMMSPLRESGNGQGNLLIEKLILKNNNLTRNLVDLTGNNELERITINNLKVDYTINNGDIQVKPFQTPIAGRKAEGYGTLFANNNLDFSLKLDLTEKDLNGKIGQKIKKIPGLSNIKRLPIALKVTGNTDKPIVTPDIKSMINSLLSDSSTDVVGGFLNKVFGGSKKTKKQEK